MFGSFLIVALNSVTCHYSKADAVRAFSEYAKSEIDETARFEVDMAETKSCEHRGVVWYLPHTPDMTLLMTLTADGRVLVLGRNGWKQVEKLE